MNLAQGNNIIKMNFLIHNQLSSKEFNAMIKYAWYKSGYLTVYPGNFRDVKQICFTWNDPSCSAYMCQETIFICCSKSLCLNHFLLITIFISFENICKTVKTNCCRSSFVRYPLKMFSFQV